MDILGFFSVENVYLKNNSYSQIKGEISYCTIKEMLKPQENQYFSNDSFLFILILPNLYLVMVFISTVSPTSSHPLTPAPSCF